MEIFQPSFRGKNLISRKDSGGKYIEMSGSESMLYIPVGVLPNSIYQIEITVAKKCGNGILYCNIYGNSSYDFPHTKIICNEPEWTKYSFEIKTLDFPKQIPMIFRMWRKPTGTGSLLIRKIIVELNENKDISEMAENEIFEPEEKNPSEQNTNNISGHIKLNPEHQRAAQIKAPAQHKQTIDTGRNIASVPCLHSAGSLELFRPIPPKILPIENGIDGIKLSAIISIFNRKSYFERSLFSISKQTMSKSDFEIVVVDDKSSDDIFNLCVIFSKLYGIKIQYILIDRQLGAIPPLSFNQALTNNIGFKQSRGKVVVIVGPETMLSENCFEDSWNSANEGFCVYGDIYRSSQSFVNYLSENEDRWKNLKFSDLLNITGAKEEQRQLGGFWWYYVAVRKEHIMNINGVDEQFMKGITAEDDNFAFRMYHSGVPLIRNHKIIGIHQDHSSADQKDLHSIRNTAEWKILRNHNIGLLNSWFIKKDPVANHNIDWGTDKAIIKKEIL